MRSGGPASPRAVASSSSAARVLPWSASQRACSRASVSAALRSASAASLRFSPRWARRRWTGSAALRREEGFHVRGVGDQAREVDLARDRRGPDVVLLDEPGQDLLVRGVARGVQQVDVPPDELAVAQHEQLDRRLVVLAGHADEVQLGLGEGLHLLALHRPLDGPDLVPQGRRSFVVRALGGDGHLGTERLDEGLLATLQEQLHLGDVLGVVGLRDGRDARALAALDVIQEARPLEGLDPVDDVDRAGPEREEAADQVHRLVDARRGRVWAEVAAPVVDQLARALDAREVVRVGHLDIGIALVVLEPDVEPRPIPLDEVRLKQEGLRDRVGQGDLEVRRRGR